MYDHYCFTPDHLYNVNETGLSTEESASKVIAKTGSRQVGQVTSGEKGETIIAICCIGALGKMISLAMVFPRVNLIT